jgi:hypothetical protein
MQQLQAFCCSNGASASNENQCRWAPGRSSFEALSQSTICRGGLNLNALPPVHHTPQVIKEGAATAFAATTLQLSRSDGGVLKLGNPIFKQSSAFPQGKRDPVV